MALKSEHKEKLQGEDLHEKGCVTKHPDKGNFSQSTDAQATRCHYRNQGYTECSSPGKRLHYNLDFVSEKKDPGKRWKRETGGKVFKYVKWGVTGSRTITDPTREPGAWDIGMGVNFKIGYLPYNHNYHHMMPWEAVKKELTFTEAHHLQDCGYNLNAGNNMIILPREDKIARIMALISHPNNHKLYTEHVQVELNNIRSQVQEQKELHEQGKKKAPADFKKMLEAWQAKMFKSIIDYGKQVADSDGPADLNAIAFCLINKIKFS